MRVWRNSLHTQDKHRNSKAMSLWHDVEVSMSCNICYYNDGTRCKNNKSDAYMENTDIIKYCKRFKNKVETGNNLKPSHYNSGDFDVIAFCFKHDVPFWAGNIIKYVFRAGKKDKNKEIEDIEKAIEYANRRIKYLKGE